MCYKRYKIYKKKTQSKKYWMVHYFGLVILDYVAIISLDKIEPGILGLLLKPGPGPWTQTLKNLYPEKPRPWKTCTLKILDPEKRRKQLDVEKWLEDHII